MFKNLLVLAAGAAILLALSSASSRPRNRLSQGTRRRAIVNQAAPTRRSSPPVYPQGFRSLSTWHSDTKH